jgi:hypothetical protein
MSKSKMFAQFPQSENMQIATNTYDHFVVKPPVQNLTRGRIPYTLVIDSRTRDYHKYPNSNHYQIKLRNELRDVVSLQLIQGCISQSEYIINDYNNKIYFRFREGDVCSPLLCAIFPNGDYDELGLTVVISLAMTSTSQTTGSNVVYAVELDPFTHQYSIRSDSGKPFFLYFLQIENYKENNSNEYMKDSIGPIIGYPPLNYEYEDGRITSGSTGGSDEISFTMSCLPKLARYDIFYMKEYGQTSTCELCCVPLIGTSCTICRTIKTITLEGATGLDGITFTTVSINGNRIVATVDGASSSTVANIINKRDSTVRIVKAKRTAPYPTNINKSCSAVLRLREANRLNSDNVAIDDAFTILYFHDGKSTIVGSNLADRPEIKYYNPALSRLMDINIDILTMNGQPYNTNGRDHILEFEIMYMNAPGKYDIQ